MEIGSGFDDPAIFPSCGLMTRHPLPSTGSPRGEFPRFVGTMRCSDSLSPIPDRLRFLALRYRLHPEAEYNRVSQVPGEPLCAHALLSDPGGTSTPGLCGASVLPSAATDYGRLT